jgi:hypothetical protein
MQTPIKAVLVSFADGAFLNRKTQFSREAKNMNVFDEIRVYDSSLLPQAFRDEHMSFMSSNARGFGYWIWKPLIISLMLDEISDDALVVYMDVGCTLNPAGRPRMLEYLDIAIDNEFKMLSFQNVHTEYIWTKADLAKRLCVHRKADVMSTSQLSSGMIVLGKTSSNVDLVRKWQEIALEDNYHFSDDSPSEIANHIGFREHRHDQSISSLLRKIRGTAVSHYEVQAYDKIYHKLKPFLPASATRLRE